MALGAVTVAAGIRACEPVVLCCSDVVLCCSDVVFCYDDVVFCCDDVVRCFDDVVRSRHDVMLRFADVVLCFHDVVRPEMDVHFFAALRAAVAYFDSLVFLAFPLSYKNQPRQAQKSKKERARTKQDQVLRSNCCCLKEGGGGRAGNEFF